MNKELLLRVADAIEAHPENLIMDDWAMTDLTVVQRDEYDDFVERDEYDDFVEPECGTAACVAGWILLESGYEPVYGDTASATDIERAPRTRFSRRKLEHWVSPTGGVVEGGESANEACHVLDVDGGKEVPYVRWVDEDDDFHTDALWYAMGVDGATMAALLREWAEDPGVHTLTA